jgi:hypothetical protein
MTMADDQAACKVCHYAAGDDKSFLTGQMECHRYPPVQKGPDGFAKVSPSSWCGEFCQKSDV